MGCDTLPPKAINTASKLGQFGAAKPANGLIQIDSEPFDRPADGAGAAANLAGCRVQNFTNFGMRMRKLPPGQDRKNLLAVHARYHRRELSREQPPTSILPCKCPRTLYATLCHGTSSLH